MRRNGLKLTISAWSPDHWSHCVMITLMHFIKCIGHPFFQDVTEITRAGFETKRRSESSVFKWMLLDRSWLLPTACMDVIFNLMKKDV